MQSHLPIEQYPTLEDLEKWISGTLPPEKQEAIQEWMSNDPFLSDAIEGLRSVSDRKELRYRLKRITSQSRKRLYIKPPIKEKLHKRRSRVEPVNMFQIIGAAAAAFLFLGVTVFIFFNTSPQPAMQTETLAAPPVIEDSTSSSAVIVENKPSSSTPATETLEDIPSSSDIEIPEQISNPTDIPGQSNKPPRAAFAEQIQDQEIDAAKDHTQTTTPELNSSESITSLSIDDEAQSIYSPPIPSDSSSFLSKQQEVDYNSSRKREDEVRTFARAGKQSKTENTFLSLRDSAVQAYNQEEYSMAYILLDKALKLQPKDHETIFYMARVQLAMGRYKEGVFYLRYLYNLPDQPWKDIATWQLAQTYFKIGQDDQARKMLKELAQSETTYGDSARQVLSAQP